MVPYKECPKPPVFFLCTDRGNCLYDCIRQFLSGGATRRSGTQDISGLTGMTNPIQKILHFLVDNTPDGGTLALAGPPALIWAAACLMLAGHLKRHANWQTGYTRKLFHFLVFGTVVIVHSIWGSRGVCLFGGMASAVIAYAVIRGPGHIMYEAMAREKDAPRRTHYVIVPYFATLLGGLATNLFFPATAVLGYLVAGIGDAAAEPVGTRFGRHQYRVPAFGGVRATRSLEGSAAVFVASVLSLAVYLALTNQLRFSGTSLWAVAAIALVATPVEAVSPHGWDNTTMQIVPALLGAMWL
jgi:phytol kinase